MDKTIKYTCQACEGFFKLNEKGLVVKHGFRRPGDGFLRGECLGVGHLPYEASCELMRELRDGLQRALDTAVSLKKDLETKGYANMTDADKTAYNYADRVVSYNPWRIKQFTKMIDAWVKKI